MSTAGAPAVRASPHPTACRCRGRPSHPHRAREVELVHLERPQQCLGRGLVRERRRRGGGMAAADGPEAAAVDLVADDVLPQSRLSYSSPPPVMGSFS